MHTLKNTPKEILEDVSRSMDEKTVKKMLQYATIMRDSAESDASLRHVPSPEYFKAKKRLRKRLEALPKDVLLTLCHEILGDVKTCSPKALLDHRSAVERLIHFSHQLIAFMASSKRLR